MEIGQAWYRISIKALIYDKQGRILLCKEPNGMRDLPGGGLNHGENSIICLKRELKEEMGLDIIGIIKTPKYFITAHKPESSTRPWIANVCYEVKINSLDFKQSEECIDIGFFEINEIKKLKTFINVQELINLITLQHK